MPRLDHVNIKALDQEAMRDFLIDVLGVTRGRGRRSISTATGSISTTWR